MTFLYGQALHLAPDGAAERKLESLAYFVDLKSIPPQYEAALFINDGSEIFRTFKFRRAFRRVFEETSVRQVKALNHFLRAL